MPVVNQWNQIRIKRIRSELNACVSRVERCPLSLNKGPNPYAKIGEAICRAAFELFKPEEIPIQFRACPWIFVISEITKHYPQDGWNVMALVRVVEFYRSHTACEPANEENLTLFG